jgi:hypothetical protein
MTLIEASSFLALVLLPGFLLVLIFGNLKRDFLVSLPLSCGLIYAIGNYSYVIGLQVGKSWYVVVVGALLGLVAYRRKKIHKFSGSFSNTDKLALLSSFLVGVILLLPWWRAAGSLGQLLPNHDAMNHSYFIRNIVETQSIRISDALRLFPLGAGTSGSFYPLGLHSVIALASQISGVSINGGMNAVTLLLGVTVFPVSMWIWSRELLTNSKMVSVVTPIAVFLLSSVFPWAPRSWGGMPTIVTMSVAPVVAVVVTDYLYAPTSKGLVVVVLALVGVFSMHPTELVLVFLLASALLFKRGVIPYKNVMGCGIKVAIGSAIALAPVCIATAGGVSERSLVYQSVVDVGSTIGHILLFSLSGATLPMATILLVAGIIYTNRNHNSVPTWCLAITISITALAARFPENSLVRFTTKPWYGQVQRLNYNVVYFAVPLLVCGISLLLSARKSSLMRFISIGTTGLVLLIGSIQVSESNGTLLKIWYDGAVPVNRNSISAFQWMAEHIAADEYVLTDDDRVDGSTWMYALTGVRPVMYGNSPDASHNQWRAKMEEVRAHIGNLSSRPDLIDFLRTNKIRYIYYDLRTNVLSPIHTFTLETIRNDSALRNVFDLQNAQVFELGT